MRTLRQSGDAEPEVPESFWDLGLLPKFKTGGKPTVLPSGAPVFPAEPALHWQL